MFKNRPFLMLLTGVFLALVLWGLVLLAQQGKRVKTKAQSQLPTASQTSVPSIDNEMSVSPASVLMIVQSGHEYSLSGKGTAGAGLSLIHKESVLSQTQVNAQGEWVLSFIMDEESNEAFMLSLLMITPQGYKVRSDQSLVFVPNSVAINENNKEPAVKALKSLIVLTAPGAHSRVMQTPFESLPTRDGFVLEAIDYDNSGGVIFSGMSLRQGKVRVYANNKLVGESSVDITGRWSLIFGNIMPVGKYDLAFELVSNTEAHSTKLVLPFVRVKPVRTADQTPDISVQRHEDYIQIGRSLYGGGYQFTVIYAPLVLVP